MVESSPARDAETSRIRVALDVTSLTGPRTGVGHVTATIVEHLSRRHDVELVAYAVSRRGSAARDMVLPAGVSCTWTRVPARVLFRSWQRIPWPRIDRWTGPVDVVHGTNFVVPPTRAAALVTVHDLVFATRPELVTAASRRYHALLRAALRRGATAHVFSRTIRDSVVEHLGWPPERVVCIHPGIADTATGHADTGHRLAGSDRYVLALGTIEPRKNHPRLVAAFDALADDDPGVRLVVAGADGWGVDAFDEAVSRARHGDRVVRRGYVSDDERRHLLAGAVALAYPSLDEGFGHPPFEAMRAGVPVIAARAGALPELIDGAALLVDPESVDELAAGLARVVHHEPTRRRLIAAGHDRAARFTWESATEALVGCYRRLARR